MILHTRVRGRAAENRDPADPPVVAPLVPDMGRLMNGRVVFTTGGTAGVALLAIWGALSRGHMRRLLVSSRLLSSGRVGPVRFGPVRSGPVR